jgi:hypothetical protein
MKKAGGEIKRRKRVIPATLVQHPLQPAGEHSSRASISLDHVEHYHAPTANNAGQSSPALQPLPPMRDRPPSTNGDHNHAPPPVDFTTYHPPSPSNNTLPPLVNFPLPESVLNNRKRSYDDANASSPADSTSTTGGHHHRPRLAHILDADPPRSTSGSAIDPSLSGTDANSDGKKAYLEAERERIRAQLAMVEAQLARMESDR